jgi:tetratricopeptide (TPR) repeat protein
MTGAVAWTFDRKLTPFFGKFRPPRYDALIEFRLAQADFGGGFSQEAHFARAAALDPEFDLARVQICMLLINQERFEEAAKELAAVEANLGRMVPAERAMVRMYRAVLDGRLLDSLAALREWAALSEFPASFQFDIGAAELALNRPAEAIRAISSLPVDWQDLGYAVNQAYDPRYNFAPTHYLAIACHMNRDYECQLRVSREAQHRFPGVLLFHSGEAGALAALGRLDEIEKVIEACQAVKGGVRAGSPGGVMSAAASELRAHGHRDASLKMAERALAWYRTHLSQGTDGDKELVWEFLRSEKWAEAKSIADVLLIKTPDDIDLRGVVGALAACLGDAAQARRIDSDLAALTRPFLHGRHTYQRARIAAQLGEKDRSVALLRDAFAQGLLFSLLIHRDPNLEPLRGYPPYEELMRPKG